MWPYLRNIFAREQVISTDTSRQAHLKRKSPIGIAASAALLSSAIAALGAPVASGVVANARSRPATAGASGLAVEWAVLGAQSKAGMPVGFSRPVAGGLPPVSVMRTTSDGSLMQPSLRHDLRARPLDRLSLNEPVLATLCSLSPYLCAPLAPAANPHEWSGRIAANPGAVHLGVTGPSAMDGTPSTLSSPAPLSMPAADAGSFTGRLQGGSRAAWTPVGLPADLAAQLSRIVAGHLDVRRPVQAGDYYRIVYEPVAGNLAASSRRRVTALEIRLAGQTYRAVWFIASGRTAGDYYSFDGQRLTAEPFAMPLNYVRVSSPFGYRIHPVTGLRLLHTGVDLTAAQGTPVVAAAAGTVQFVGLDSGYGKHVVVRHARGYTTYYGHLSAFASGLRVGARVSQGQPLGAVGQSGVATGPHLHFEVRLNNQPADPLRLTSRSSAVLLAGRQRAAFDHVASVARDRLAGLSADVRTASDSTLGMR
ncbi:murein DD-endopeptidase MepM/ murein hydrolase activator NlpD [Paraburkholderia sp. GAS41]|uniref:M23 family metallopeptidase n=1 Tax=Paraburkholderia sp. GAS41 TaxID=3035134 RepID=UPI003D1AA309